MVMAMEEDEKQQEAVLVTPGEVLGRVSDIKPGRGAYAALHNETVYASLTGFRRTLSPPPDSSDQRPTVEVTGHKAHGPVPQPGSIVIARITEVMAKTASADIMCVGPKSVREKFTGIIRTFGLLNYHSKEEYWTAVLLFPLFSNLSSDFGAPIIMFCVSVYETSSIHNSCFDRQQDVRATEIDKVDMHLSFHPGDIVKALVLSLGDSRAYFLSTAKNELGVVSAESIAGACMVPVSWTEMQCPLTGQIENRKVAKVAS
ncbi:hypothetical protein Ahy_A09g043936 isoform A [Arachis hypogaea]|uniref:Exosome complex component CSL4 C-terminal domain-containing protein n=1 Tax=Arachis hypogaea TaxID=3818 RepID=A0A445BJA9_ARAHY|nr:hypothetical protein Ahy_A09g043936 isoform A [Arachis hypogaea]